MTNMCRAVEVACAKVSVGNKSLSGTVFAKQVRATNDQEQNGNFEQPYTPYQAYSRESNSTSTTRCDIFGGDLLKRGLWIHEGGVKRESPNHL